MGTSCVGPGGWDEGALEVRVAAYRFSIAIWQAKITWAVLSSPLHQLSQREPSPQASLDTSHTWIVIHRGSFQAKNSVPELNKTAPPIVGRVSWRVQPVPLSAL